MAQLDGRPATGPHIVCSKMGPGDTTNPDTAQHFVETLRLPRDVASSEGGGDKSLVANSLPRMRISGE